MKMKLKTHRGAAKRFRSSGTGKIMMKPAGKRHLLAKKSTRRKRGYSIPVQVNKSDEAGLRRLLPYL